MLRSELARVSKHAMRWEFTTPVTWTDVQAIASALPGAVEGRSYGTPAFHVRKKLFVRLWEDGEVLVLNASLDERDILIEADPAVFFLTAHYRDYPKVLARLAALDREGLTTTFHRSYARVAQHRSSRSEQTRR